MDGMLQILNVKNKLKAAGEGARPTHLPRTLPP